MNRKVRPLKKQLDILTWIICLSALICPFTGLVLLGKGYSWIGHAVLFFPVAQMTLLVAIALEDTINMGRISRGKEPIEILTRLFFPEHRYIMQLYKSGREQEALEYAMAWLDDPDKEK